MLLRVETLSVEMEKVKEKCEMCDFSTANRGYLKRHFRVKHEGVKGFQCDKCDYSAGHRYAVTLSYIVK